MTKNLIFTKGNKNLLKKLYRVNPHLESVYKSWMIITNVRILKTKHEEQKTIVSSVINQIQNIQTIQFKYQQCAH